MHLQHGRKTSSTGGIKWVKQRLTISFVSFQIHSGGQHALGTHSTLQLELVLRRRALDEFGLVYETGMPSLCRAREPSCYFPLRTEKLYNDNRLGKSRRGETRD